MATVNFLGCVPLMGARAMITSENASRTHRTTTTTTNPIQLTRVYAPACKSADSV